MPSWSFRNNNPSTPPATPANPSQTGFPLPFQTKAGVPRSISQNVPALSSMSSGSTPTSAHSKRGHSRSISQPTTSPFAASARNGDRNARRSGLADSDDSDDDFNNVSGFLSGSPRKTPTRAGPADEFLTGKCMTCNTTVRWPRALKVFRCTQCLTVNDLEPCKDLPDLPDDGPPARSETITASVIPRKAVPLCVERTKAIIDDCIMSYLQALLERANSNTLPANSGPDVNGGRSERFAATGTGHLPVAASQNPARFPSPKRAFDPQRRRPSIALPPGSANPEYEPANHSPPPSLGTPSRSLEMRFRSNPDSQTGPNEDVGRVGSEHEGNEHFPVSMIFNLIEDHIISSFRGCDCLNSSFMTARLNPRAASDGNPPKMDRLRNAAPGAFLELPVFEPDAKTLLLGELGENSSWWMNDWMQSGGDHGRSRKNTSNGHRIVASKSPRIDWSELAEWYQLVLNAGSFWVERWTAMAPKDTCSMEFQLWASVDLSLVDREITEARIHLQRTLMKASENLLKRPRRPLKKPEDSRFLLILLTNPLLFASGARLDPLAVDNTARHSRRASHASESDQLAPRDRKSPSRRAALASRQPRSAGSAHPGIIKRILGLMANLPDDCHHCLVSWFSRLPEGQFDKIVDLVGGFVTYRLTRQQGRKRSGSSMNNNTLIPSFSSAAANTPAELHAAINGRSPSKAAKNQKGPPVIYAEDWQVRGAARVMALLFAANSATRKSDGFMNKQYLSPNVGLYSRNETNRRSHTLPISAFYNTLLDYSDLVADFEAWEQKTGRFSFCQYPFFLSIWAKIHILEHDARRQMEVKAREAFFNSILNRKAVSQYLVLKVRRECLVEDSLQSVSEVVGSGQEEIKKGLRIQFVGEDGVDAGGLRKEWFLLLVREIFDPDHGLFVYDDDSRYCYFNPYCFESSEQFFLVGVLLGLAIYNSTILDIALPPFAFKKLLAAAPHNNSLKMSTSRPSFKCTLDDLAEYRPTLAKGLKALLDFDGDVAETFCYDFVAHTDRYGELVEVPLCPDGKKRAVTNANRREFVALYIRYLLDTAVVKQFEPFKRGFFTVCGGNALSLFRPEEIELLVRGSDEPLDVPSLRAVATYDNWSTPDPEAEPQVRWFWQFFADANPQTQRKILSFITGSDRIPAMGAASLMIRLACLGDDSSRYPTARTCFNTLGLYRYPTKEKLEQMLCDAVANSEGFGLK